MKIHRIQSGQVIVDLCSVVKELVENSVDAGATSIGKFRPHNPTRLDFLSDIPSATLDVRFKNQGLDSIEVQDNGSGVSPENYPSLALKHCTSKLTAYDDLSDLQTFGFRGEALSSLSALSQLSVVTCQAPNVPKGAKLKFSSSGALENKSLVSAKQGTTVVIENLFHNLPVRRRELERHIKREWAKVISILNQHACILTGVKFTVSQQPNKGKKIIMFSTKGNPTTRENIVNIFGAKTMAAMIPLDLILKMEPTSSLSSKHRKGASLGPFKIAVKGHVSRPAHGEGRQAPDRQMFFVNGRPCGLPQFAKIFNEVYRAFNASQSPFIFADIQLDTHLYDVNVSPDKRTILLHEQGRMLETMRESLNALFEAQDYSVPATQLATQKTPSSIGRSTAPQVMPDLAASSPSPSVTGSQTDKAPENATDARTGESEPDSTSASSGPNLPSVNSLTTNLISSWVQKKVTPERQGASNPTPSGPAGPKEGDNSSQKEPTAGPESSSMPVEADLEPSTAQIPELVSLEEDMTSGRVLDVHSRLDELGQNLRETGQDSRDEDTAPRLTSPSTLRCELPGFRTAGALYHSRKRAAPDVATVTIGDQTVTSLIGPYSKRRREDSSPTSTRAVGSAPQKSNSSATPSFGGRLSQLFSANSQAEDVSERRRDEEQELIEDSEVDENRGVEEDTYEGEKPDQSSLSSDDGSRDMAGMGAGERATDPAQVQALDTTPQNELAGERWRGDTKDGGNEEPAPETKPADARSDRRTLTTKIGRRKEPTLHCQQHISVELGSLDSKIFSWWEAIHAIKIRPDSSPSNDNVDGIKDAEEKLSLTISKGDFNKMRIVGQFNLGFIVAVRPAGESTAAESARQDELFIIDQHASDEKYNFERLQASTVVQSQRLVHPKTLDLTALEEEVVLNNLPALETNGFKVTVDESGDQPVGSRCQLLALPLSKETTFTLSDLEELISLLEESHATSKTTAVPRPSRVRKMFAMRACRSSIMVGNPLQQRHMEKLVRRMGELDKPWNCPHGRPTMRHLCSLGPWNRAGWEGDRRPAISGQRYSWAEYLKR